MLICCKDNVHVRDMHVKRGFRIQQLTQISSKNKVYCNTGRSSLYSLSDTTRLMEPNSVKLLKSASSRTFSHFAPHTWNALTISIRESDSLCKFEKCIKNYFYPILCAAFLLWRFINALKCYISEPSGCCLRPSEVQPYFDCNK